MSEQTDKRESAERDGSNPPTLPSGNERFVGIIGHLIEAVEKLKTDSSYDELLSNAKSILAGAVNDNVSPQETTHLTSGAKKL